MHDDDEILENLPEYAFDLLDAAQRLLLKLDHAQIALSGGVVAIGGGEKGPGFVTGENVW